MNELMQYYFKQQRIQKKLSLEKIAKTSLIELDQITKFENNTIQFSDSQLITLFSAIKIDYRKLKKEYEAIMREVENVLEELILYNQNFRDDFKVLSEDVTNYKRNPAYKIFLVLQLMIQHRENDLVVKNMREIETYFDYLPPKYKQIYFIGRGQNKEFNNLLAEALELYYTAANLTNTKFITTMAQEYVAIASLKLNRLGPAYKYFVLAKKRCEEEGNYNSAIVNKMHGSIVFMQMGLYSESVDSLTDCLNDAQNNNLTPMIPVLLNNLIMALTLKKSYHELLKYCEPLVRTKKYKADLYFYKAWAYYNINEFEAASYVISNAKKDIPDNVINIALINMVEALLNNTAEIEIIFEDTVKIMYENTSILMVYFIIDIITDYYMERNEYEKACKYFILKRHYEEEANS